MASMPLATSAMAAAAASESSLSPPPAIARVSPGNIRSLILEKEKELHDINEYRIRTLETLLREKETAAHAYKQKFNKLQEDFKYNLKLLEGRDEELALYDTNFASLKNVLRDREAEISELKAQVADLQTDVKQEQKRASEQEVFFQQKLKDARAQMEGARWNFDDELRRTRDEMEQAKRRMERQMREQQEDLETQRREITLTFDDVMRQREAEFKQTVDELQAKTRELELKVKSTTRESEMAKERCEELKMKMENMQKMLNESEKEAKAMEWQLSDVRASKDAKIAELEDEILKLQEVKQSLLDEYEGKMAELLQSLHSVEKAFVQQKAQYEDDLQRFIRKKETDSQDMSLRMDAKMQSLMAKLRDKEELCEKLQADIKQATWESEDKHLEKDREIERLKQEIQDVEEQKHSAINDMKQQLWTIEREQISLQEKMKEATLQLQMNKEKGKLQRQELNETVEKQEDLKREIVTLNLRWENKWQEHEQELSSRHELRLREVQQARDRLLNEKQATEDRLVHAENELHRLRTEMLTLKSNARINESFGNGYANGTRGSGNSQHQSSARGSREDSLPAPSPLWSDDNGTLSPLPNMSPMLTQSPQQHSTNRDSAMISQNEATLQAENAKLRDLIRQMREALSEQAQEVAASISPSGSGDQADTLKRLSLAEKQCVLLEAKLHDAEAKLRYPDASVDSSALKEMNEKLTLCQAELIQANRTIDARNKRIEELESQLKELGGSSGGSGLAANLVVTDVQVSELKRKLSSAHSDIERLVKERTQLMELSNQLTSELRRFKETSPDENRATNGKSLDFTGKKDYENLIADLSRSLEEARVNNKTLKKELRRMVKLQVLSQQQAGDGDGGDNTARSRAPSMMSTDGDTNTEEANGPRRHRSSTLSMMKALETNADSRRSSMYSVASSAQPTSVRGSGGEGSRRDSVNGVFDEELLSLVRNKLSSPVPTAGTTRRTTTRASTAIPQTIPEHENENDDAEEKEEAKIAATRPATTNSFNGSEVGGQTSMRMLFSRERMDSMDSVGESTAKVSDARVRLQQAKEMLLLAGKKAERSTSLASFASAPAKLSDRETPSQKSAIKRLKELQTKRAEMVQERKKVRNYSMAT
ncbi:hypothetical protein Poli38472_003739 [Pythium oligandrum]|uniref:Uncharacterized protein n=1 Tax=Pythium oligandrum TaxID=41045 RepID=A0A8K1CMT4_PYTOL|nr:hypothetical protein Poli38472_003739 [Pythium oligandrum]|eukprot:TMW65974.1 hypothetical protein Poli38472_003739 [Pythium oligandrum]